MDIGSVLIILALLILVGLFISRPLFERQAVVIDKDGHEISSLMAERDRVLNALEELDFDYTLGKIPDADYPAQRAALLHRGAEVLQRLDQLQVQSPGEDAEARLEAAIAARRADTARQSRQPALSTDGGPAGQIASGEAAALTPKDDALEALIAARRRERQDKSAGFCPQCGRAVQKSDRFCPKCGAQL